MKKKITIIISTALLATSLFGQNNNKQIQKRAIIDTVKFNHVNSIINANLWDMLQFRQEFFSEQPEIVIHKNKKVHASATNSKWKIDVYPDGIVALYDVTTTPHKEITNEEASKTELLAKGLLIDDLIDYEIAHNLYDQSNTKKSKVLMTVFLMKKLVLLDLSQQQLSKIKALNIKVAKDIRDTRKNCDINAEIMYRKDIGHTLHKNKKLPKEEQFPFIEKNSLLNKIQMEGMIQIEDLRNEYRENVMTLLTSKQKQKLSGLKKKKH